MAWMEEPAERLKLLRAMFDDAGLNYQVDQNARGWFYVRLGYETRGGSPVVVTAIVQELVVRVTAHAVLGGLSETERNRLNRDWGFGRFCLGEGGVDATASLYIGGRPPDGELIRFVVEHLVDSGETAGSGQVPLFDVAGGLGLSPSRIADDLRQAQIQFATRNDGHVLAARFSSDAGPDVIVEWFAASRNLLRCRARHVRDVHYAGQGAVVAEVENMNSSLSIGTLIRQPEQGLITYEVTVPVGVLGMSPQLLDWQVDKAIFVLDRLAPLAAA